MEHNKNNLTSKAGRDSAAGTSIAPIPPEPPDSLDPVPFDLQRKDGWTPERQRQFLEELADCGVIQEAAARVGMSRKSAWQLRRRAAGTAFGSAWEAALEAGMKRLHSVAFERAIEGVVKRVYYRGEVVGVERVYDTRLLLSLLAKAGNPYNHEVGCDARLHWPEYLDAVEQGLSHPPPNLMTDRGEHLVVDDKGDCWTNFPPPQNAVVAAEGKPGDANYWRRLTEEELKIARVREARCAAEQEAERARFFSLEK